VLGSTFIDPVWGRIVAWNADNVPRVAQAAARDLVVSCLKAKPDGAAMLAKFDALADAPEPAAVAAE
jgi:hypothetical protein